MTDERRPQAEQVTQRPLPRARAQRAHAPRVPFALLVTGLIVGGMCALLALNTASAANELNRHKLASADADVAARAQQLQIQVAASAAPGALGSAAAALGMIPIGNPAFLSIGPDGKVRVLGNPLPASLPVQVVHTTPKPSPTPTKSKTGQKQSKPTAPTSTPTPTPTPTPNTTLPGGTR